ncbi:MAG: tetratricopeptide repeat protein [Caldilineaceae bacterium]|nr:tetratricopeptide repeat protein [Caldilineaceae bacterium]
MARQEADSQLSEAQPIALLTYAEGDVIVQSPDTSEGEPAAEPVEIHAAGGLPVYEIVRFGTTLSVNGNVTIVCYNNTVYQVQGRTDVQIAGGPCFNPTPLPHNVPGGDMIPGDDGTLILTEVPLEEEADYGRIPIIISPRNTVLLTQPTMLRWVEQAEAETYRLSLINAPGASPLLIQADEPNCTENAITTPLRICTYPWPATWSLPTGESAFLAIAGRTSVASPWLDSDRSRILLITDELKMAVDNDIAEIQLRSLDEVTERLLTAGIYWEAGIYGDAIAYYLAAQNQVGAPLLSIRLGDLYRAIELQRFAFDAYQQAAQQLDQRDDPILRAAVEFGFGAVYFTRGDFQKAESHLSTSLQLYEEVGTPKQITAVQSHLEDVRQRIP